ncbi:MAG: LCP family protein [Firmicutes bacterium]|nr:LCP family protein [Bacillota bacterium]
MGNNSAALRKQKAKANRSNIFLFSGIILAVLLIVSALWFKSIWDELFLLQPPFDQEEAAPGAETEEESDPFPEIMNVLIVGLDTRDTAARADTIMLLSLSQKSGEINIISIPRDMRVQIPGYGMDKINHSYAYGGLPLTRQTVEDFLDIRIDHYIITDFEGFINIVDILGGIELDVEKKMRYYGIDVTIELDPGLQPMDGEKALQYVRFRSDEEGDFGRVRRQQIFLKTLLREVIAFKNILKFPQILPEIAQNIKTDMELSQALKLANRLKNVEIEEINTFTLPGRAGDIEGISYVLPEEQEIRQIVDRYLKGMEQVQ